MTKQEGLAPAALRMSQRPSTNPPPLPDVTLALGENQLPEGWRLKLYTPDLPDDRWNSLDLELCRLQGQLHYDLSHGFIPAPQVADQYCLLLTKFLSSKEEFREEIKQFHPHPPSHKLDDARKLKKTPCRRRLNGRMPLVRIRESLIKPLNSTTFSCKNQRNQLNVKGNLNMKNYINPTSSNLPNLPAMEPLTVKLLALNSAKPQLTNSSLTDTLKPPPIDLTKLSWFPPTNPPKVPYPDTAITPGMIKQIIRDKKSDTTPGEDGLLYGILSKLPSTHWFLATLYNKIDEDGIAPSSWTGCLLTLILKAGDPENP